MLISEEVVIFFNGVDFYFGCSFFIFVSVVLIVLIREVYRMFDLLVCVFIYRCFRLIGIFYNKEVVILGI